jgi:hypothetical protein
MPVKILDAPHPILSVTLLPTGVLIMATESRIYELKGNVWTPMEFAPDPVPEPTPAPPAGSSLFGTPSPATPAPGTPAP